MEHKKKNSEDQARLEEKFKNTFQLKFDDEKSDSSSSENRSKAKTPPKIKVPLNTNNSLSPLKSALKSPNTKVVNQNSANISKTKFEASGNEIF